MSFVYSGRLDEPSQEALAEHSVAQMSILEYVDASYYRYGLWIRAAWLAAESGQLDFFRGESVRALGALHPPDQALEDEIVSLRQEIRGLGSESDLATLSARLESIAREHAN